MFALFGGRLRAMGTATLAVAVLAGCTGSSPSRSTIREPGTAAIDTDGTQRLWILDGDRVVPFENGRSVSTGGMKVEIYFSPYPPGSEVSIDLYVTRDEVPVETATVTLQYDMTVMEHGPFALLAAPTGRGHYLAPLSFLMTGDFWLDAAVATGDQESVINMFIRSVR